MVREVALRSGDLVACLLLVNVVVATKHVSDAILEEREIGLGQVTKRQGGKWEEPNPSFCHPAQTYPTLFQYGV